jgi:uncharacterized protein
MIAKELLEILVCPVCKKPVIPNAAQDSLKCPQCRRVYPVRDDIPIMLIDEAVTVDDDEHARLLAKAQAEGITPTFDPAASSAG